MCTGRLCTGKENTSLLCICAGSEDGVAMRILEPWTSEGSGEKDERYTITLGRRRLLGPREVVAPDLASVRTNVKAETVEAGRTKGRDFYVDQLLF